MRTKAVRPPSVATPTDGAPIGSVPAPGELTRRLVNGDESALEECYRELGSLVRAYLRRIVDGDAEDVLQVVFFELWRLRDRLDPDKSLEGFVFSLARRRAIDSLRRYKPQLVNIDAVHFLIGEDGDAFVEQFVLAAQVKRALGDLPEQQRESIVLAYFEGRTQQEISDELNVPLGTVKARMARGLHRLAVTMREDRP